MLTDEQIILCIAGMATVTYLPRVLPMALLASRPLNPALARWLGFVPASVLAALLAPDLLLRDGALHVAADNLYLLAAVPTLLVMRFTGSLFGTVAAGMATVAAGRLFFGLPCPCECPGLRRVALRAVLWHVASEQATRRGHVAACVPWYVHSAAAGEASPCVGWRRDTPCRVGHGPCDAIWPFAHALPLRLRTSHTSQEAA